MECLFLCQKYHNIFIDKNYVTEGGTIYKRLSVSSLISSSASSCLPSRSSLSKSRAIRCSLRAVTALPRPCTVRLNSVVSVASRVCQDSRGGGGWRPRWRRSRWRCWRTCSGRKVYREWECDLHSACVVKSLIQVVDLKRKTILGYRPTKELSTARVFP